MSAAEEIMIVERSEESFSERKPGSGEATAQETQAVGAALARPVNALWRKGKEFDLPFVNRSRFNGLRLWFLIHRKQPFALKTGADNLQATL